LRASERLAQAAGNAVDGWKASIGPAGQDILARYEAMARR
jgi:hypothetical protein